MRPDGIRYSHPNASLIGKPFVGTFAPAAQGRTVTETTDGTLGRSVRAVVPATDDAARSSRSSPSACSPTRSAKRSPRCCRA